MRIFFLEVCLMKLDKGKIIKCVPDRIFHSCLKPFWKRCVTVKMCYTTQTYWYRYRNLVSIPLKIVGIVSSGEDSPTV